MGSREWCRERKQARKKKEQIEQPQEKRRKVEMTFESGQIGSPELYIHCLKVDNNCPGQQPCEID